MSNNALKLIQPVSKRDQVVSSIKTAILTGAIEPGGTIVESKTAQQLGVGIPLVREALIELEQKGYVRRVPYKGTTVTKLGREDVERIFRLRLELEALAIAWAKETATATDIRELRRITEEMKRAALELNLDNFYQNDLLFHRKIWEMSDNPYLVDALDRIVTPLFAFFVIKTSQERDNYIESAAGHEKITEAMLEMGAEDLRELMKASIAEWKEDMLNALQKEER